MPDAVIAANTSLTFYSPVHIIIIRLLPIVAVDQLHSRQSRSPPLVRRDRSVTLNDGNLAIKRKNDLLAPVSVAPRPSPAPRTAPFFYRCTEMVTLILQKYSSPRLRAQVMVYLFGVLGATISADRVMMSPGGLLCVSGTG